MLLMELYPLKTISDSHRAYMHRHKLHDRHVGWGAIGPIECRQMLEAIKPMVDGEPGLTKKLYSQMPHSIWDNHF